MKYAPGRPVYYPALVSSPAAVNHRAGGDGAVHQTPTLPRCSPNISPRTAPPNTYTHGDTHTHSVSQQTPAPLPHYDLTGEAQMSCPKRVMAVPFLLETASSGVCHCLCSFFFVLVQTFAKFKVDQSLKAISTATFLSSTSYFFGKLYLD